MMMPFVIGRPSSTRALEHALVKDKRIFLAAQHDASVDDPRPEDIYTMGCVANVVQSLKLPDGNIKVLVEGVDRARAVEWKEDKGFYRVVVKVLPRQREQSPDVDSTMSRVVSLFEQYVKLSNNLHYDAMIAAVRVDDPGKLADTIAAHLLVGVDEKQNLLEIISPVERLNRIAGILEIEVDKLQVDRRIQSRVKKQMEKAQKEYYLNEKMKAIQKELGRKDEKGNEIDELRKKIETSRMPKEVEEKAQQELKRLEAMPPMSAEATVSRNYLDWLIAVPWHKKSRESRDLKHAESVLNEDHYGLEKIKDRIMEFLAVRALVKKPKATILTLSGPPGVGKTSLAKSIARAMNRKFVRLSLGGVRDEAEIRGHRRTYIGAFPGQIIQMMKKAGTMNPVFLLDEVDKMSMDFRGDPSAALLEVLDPEQNHTFLDHYLDVEYDLSNVMFICTANVLHTIPQALRDRMEVLQLAGYTEQEKVEIAKRFLVPKAVEGAGLTAANIRFADEALQTIIQRYTREAGVRSLEREISSICRKVARKVVVEGRGFSEEIDAEKVTVYLGVPRFRPTLAEEQNEIGIATGLAWTEVGGEILVTEATLMPGKGHLTLTGKLGDVMQESAQAAMSYVRSKAEEYGIPKDFNRRHDVHIHVPEGAIPKDGPSAGITLATALVSALCRVAVRNDLAMTGEITLRGRVLPIGGLKEKVLAAHRGGIKTVLIPKENEKDIADIPQQVLKNVTLLQVEHMDQVLRHALVLTDPDSFFKPKD
ncbi:MAG: endopeptidase La, partial [Acidobacteriota bacterium]|nr:endopeptidase La [Acidobacteriota bacterium]